MTQASEQSTDYAPIFDWRPALQGRISLLIFVAASAALHAFCFYLFQIVYPLTVALVPPPVGVQLITPDSEQGRLLLRWIEAEDPALSSVTQRPIAAKPFLPPEPAHVPSYFQYRPALRQLPPYQPDLSIPSAQPPGPVSLPRPTNAASIGRVASRLHFTASAPGIAQPQMPDLKFTASRGEPPEVARFRVGIDRRGTVRYCFLEASSGDRALDEQAHRQLRLCRFPRVQDQPPALADDSFFWLTATFHWGNDLALPGGSPETPQP